MGIRAISNWLVGTDDRHRSERNNRRTSFRVESLEDRVMLSHNPMTAAEQHLNELINLARSDPNAAAVRYNTPLNQGLPAGTITTAAKPPLARNNLLRQAMELHLVDMQQNNFFSHDGSNGSTFDQRIVAAGYTPFTNLGENIAWSGTTGNLGNLLTRAENLVAGWFGSPGHRQNLMSTNFDEVGSSLITGPFTQQGQTFNAAITGQDFGNQAGNPFFTGLGCQQLNATFGICDVTQPVTGATVQAIRQSDNAMFSTTTGPTGEFDLQIPAATYSIFITGGGLNGAVQFQNIVVASQNVKLDFTASQATPIPNDPPTIDAINDINISPSTQIMITAMATDPNGHSLMFSLDQAPAGASINPTTGAFTWFAGDVGSFPVIVHVTDNGIPNLSDTEDFTITVTAGNDSTPPTVMSLFGNIVAKKVTSFSIVFSELIKPADATNPNNFTVIGAGRDKKIGTLDDTLPLGLGQLIYDPVAHRVDLPLAIAAKPGLFRITVNGTTSIHDLATNKLDGDSNGTGGDNFQQTIGVGSKLTVFDADGDSASLKFTGGVMQLLMQPAGDKGTLNLLISQIQPTLMGKIKRSIAGDGLFHLTAINSPNPFTNLLPAEFVVGP